MFRTTRKAAPAAADPAHGHLVGYDGALPVQCVVRAHAQKCRRSVRS